MRIAIVSTIRNFRWGGADALWTRSAEAAVQRGDSLFLAVTGLVAEYPAVKVLIARGVHHHERTRSDCPVPLVKRGLLKALGALGRRDPLVAGLERFRPDLVVISCAGTYDSLGEQALHDWLERSKVPYRIIANFQLEHPSLDETDRKYLNRVFDHAERIFFVSQRNIETTRKNLLNELSRAEIVHGCSVFNPIDPSGTVALPWPSQDIWSLAYVGRLDPVKGVDDLLYALSDAFVGVENWEVNIIGQGGQRSHLEACSARLGLHDRVRFHGFVENLDRALIHNHLVISPAIEEGIPMTIPEAMIKGRPVLATRVGGAEDWIVHGQTGFLCAAPTQSLLSASIREAWATRERWRSLGEAAAESARARYRPADFLKIISPVISI
jgi:glycosyltransferase involved in cell wall biosynthesis